MQDSDKNKDNENDAAEITIEPPTPSLSASKRPSLPASDSGAINDANVSNLNAMINKRNNMMVPKKKNKAASIENESCNDALSISVHTSSQLAGDNANVEPKQDFMPPLSNSSSILLNNRNASGNFNVELSQTVNNLTPYSSNIVEYRFGRPVKISSFRSSSFIEGGDNASSINNIDNNSFMPGRRKSIADTAVELLTLKPIERTTPTPTFMEQCVKCLYPWQLKFLYIFVPLAIISRYFFNAPNTLLFISSFLGLIPLAGQLGDFTEDLCLRTNPVIGALINVTFGNATELIISIFALHAGYLELIKMSLLGSVLGNMLLVLGSAFFIGGCRLKTLAFNPDAANTYIPLLLLSVSSFVIATGYSSTHIPQAAAVAATKGLVKANTQNTVPAVNNAVDPSTLRVSHGIALVACVAYACYMYFQLFTHVDVFEEKVEDGDEKHKEKVHKGQSVKDENALRSSETAPLISSEDKQNKIKEVNDGVKNNGDRGSGSYGGVDSTGKDNYDNIVNINEECSVSSHSSRFSSFDKDPKKERKGKGSYLVNASSDNEEEEEEPEFTAKFGIGGLAIISVLISLLSSILVDSIYPAAEALNFSNQFLGIILVPIVGNAAEHASAIMMAYKNKIDIAIGIALGSSIQISLFMMPFLVVVGWIVGVPLDMNFHPYSVAIMFISVLVAGHITCDGLTNWLEGVMLLCVYMMVGILFFNGI